MQQNSSNFQEQMLPAEQNLHTLCLHELHWFYHSGANDYSHLVYDIMLTGM
jgi:hypothetical protein